MTSSTTSFVTTTPLSNTLFLRRKHQSIHLRKPLTAFPIRTRQHVRHFSPNSSKSPSLITCTLSSQQALVTSEPPVQSTTPTEEEKSNSHIPLRIGKFTFQLSGRMLLSIVPLIMASFLACAKLLYIIPVALSPSLFNAARLLVASLFFLPTISKETIKAIRAPSTNKSRFSFLKAGLELGLMMFVINFLQILGLRYTGASRAAFLSQLSTVLVPLTAGALGLELLTTRMAFGAMMAFGGVGLLTMGASGSGNEIDAISSASTTLLGDGFEIASAILMTVYMLRMGYHARRAKQTGPMVAVKVCTQAVMSIGWLSMKTMVGAASAASMGNGIGILSTAAASGWTSWAILLNIALVLWAGVVVSAGASWMQTKGQAAVPASETAVLFASQPVWASMMAAVLFGERLGMAGMVGAGMIVTGTIVSSIGEKGKKKT